jgi:hypothetical protein
MQNCMQILQATSRWLKTHGPSAGCFEHVGANGCMPTSPHVSEPIHDGLCIVNRHLVVKQLPRGRPQLLVGMLLQLWVQLLLLLLPSSGCHIRCWHGRQPPWHGSVTHTRFCY